MVNGDGCSSSCQFETCATQGGDICALDEICPGTPVIASDTSTCRSQSCQLPSWENCNQCGSWDDGCWNTLNLTI